MSYKESSDNSACFECKFTEVARWSAATSPIASNFPERLPTVSSFLSNGEENGKAMWSPPFSPTFMERSPTFATFSGATGLLGGKRHRDSKGSEVSIVASDEPLSPGVPTKGDWRTSGDSKESQGKEQQGEEVGGRGLKRWFRNKFK